MYLAIKLYLCRPELLEIELYIFIKMDLALNNLKRLIYHKIQTKKSMLS